MAARYTLSPEMPSGLVYRPDFLTEEDERLIIGEIVRLEFKPVVMKGVEARRTVVHFGFDYAYDFRNVHKFEDASFPPWLRSLRERVGREAKIEASLLEQSLLAKYPAGAGIGWHRDAPQFGSTVIGVSLACEGTMRFRRTVEEGTEQYILQLAPRSLYIIGGAARWRWQHSLNPTKALRYSITFRTIATKNPMRIEP